MRCFQRTSFVPVVLLCGCIVAGMGGSAARAADAGRVIIETVDEERFVGRVLEATDEFVRLESATVGEVRIPRAQIRTQTGVASPAGGLTVEPATSTPALVVTATATPASAAAHAAETPKAPAPGLWRKLLHLPSTVTASVAGGFSRKAGVVDQSGHTLSLTVGYYGAKNVFNSVLQYEYAKAGALTAANDFYLDSLLQHNFSARNFLLAGGRYRQDQVMAVDQELNVFIAPGRYLTKTPKFEFGVAAGLSGLYQDYGAAAPGLPNPPRTRDLGVTAYQFLQYRVLPRVQLTQNNLYTHSVENSDKFIYRFMLTATITLHERLSLLNQFGYGYDSEPAPGIANGQTSVTSQLSYQF